MTGSGEAWKNLSDGSTGTVGFQWFQVTDGTHKLNCIGVGSQYNQTAYDTQILGDLCKIPSGPQQGDFVSTLDGTYIAAPGTTNSAQDLGDLFGFNHTASSSSSLGKLRTAIASTAASYNLSGNSTIRALGPEEAGVGIALGLLIKDLPSNVSGLTVTIDGIMLQSGTEIPCQTNCPNYAIGPNGDQISKILNCILYATFFILGITFLTIVTGFACGIPFLDIITCVLAVVAVAVGGGLLWQDLQNCEGGGVSIDARTAHGAAHVWG